ncbi:MAG: hypothetical protein ACLVB5_07770 [Christensenellales bacterium]
MKLGEHLRQKLVGALHGQAEAQKPGLPAGKRGEDSFICASICRKRRADCT